MLHDCMNGLDVKIKQIKNAQCNRPVSHDYEVLNNVEKFEYHLASTG